MAPVRSAPEVEVLQEQFHTEKDISAAFADTLADDSDFAAAFGQSAAESDPWAAALGDDNDDFLVPLVGSSSDSFVLGF